MLSPTVLKNNPNLVFYSQEYPIQYHNQCQNNHELIYREHLPFFSIQYDYVLI